MSKKKRQQYGAPHDTLFQDSSVDNFTEIVHLIFLIVGSLIKSFVYTLSQIVWLFAGIFILIGSFFWLNQQGLMTTQVQDIKGLWKLIDLFRNYWGLLFGIVWIWEAKVSVKEMDNAR